MSFTSSTFGQRVYDDSNYQMLLEQSRTYGADNNYGTGYVQRDWQAHPYGSLPYANPLPQELILDMDEIIERIEHREKTGTQTSQLLRRNQVRPKNQGQTNYCWNNCVVGAVESNRFFNGLPYIPLSAASVGGPITNYRNVGGWPIDAVKFVAEKGVVPSSLWPDNAIDRRYDTPETQAARNLHKIISWWDIPQNSMQAILSLLCQNITIPVGLLWWRHAVEYVDPLYFGGRDWINSFGTRLKNSWGDWEDDGYGILRGSKMVPDDAIAIARAA
jgi:hypothetical protein